MAAKRSGKGGSGRRPAGLKPITKAELEQLDRFRQRVVLRLREVQSDPGWLEAGSAPGVVVDFIRGRVEDMDEAFENGSAAELVDAIERLAAMVAVGRASLLAWIARAKVVAR